MNDGITEEVMVCEKAWDLIKAQGLRINHVVSETANYNTIIQFYQESVYQRDADMEIAINE